MQCRRSLRTACTDPRTRQQTKQNSPSLKSDFPEKIEEKEAIDICRVEEWQSTPKFSYKFIIFGRAGRGALLPSGGKFLATWRFLVEFCFWPVFY